MSNKAASALTRERFPQGLSYADYVAQVETNKDQFEKGYEATSLRDEDRQFFATLRQKWPGLKVLVIGEDWCPDVYTNVPILMRIVEAAQNMEVRVFPRDKNLDLMNEYLHNGNMSIPVIAFFDENWQEIGRFIERPVNASKFLSDTRAELAKSGLSDEEQMKELRRRFRDARDRFRQETIDEIRQIFEKAG